jgi:hypothetical protein
MRRLPDNQAAPIVASVLAAAEGQDAERLARWSAQSSKDAAQIRRELNVEMARRCGPQVSARARYGLTVEEFFDYGVLRVQGVSADEAAQTVLRSREPRGGSA